ncbi:MAG: GGDEF domain-containing protein, partial [Chromatiales bacterium]|nr:GGDEF domain-containing protein [Chromatiales bacterium]
VGEGMEIAERLRRRVEAEAWPQVEGRLGTITISVGVAAYPEHGQTAEQLFYAADLAMYKAKESGRNRVCTAG